MVYGVSDQYINSQVFFFFLDKMKMDEKLYHSLVVAFLALQTQLRTFMEDQPGLTKVQYDALSY